eukprot:TRINITY_DN229_c0_g1_i1.p1 TRINITY_DN229_c0_g1~~TRINITY_DN229_c0_g1_i1.p1  ORF type:complete len:348 (-),score=67.99 TRINITY_DN229_c0_g1_i1:112-1155(-)
MAPQLPEEKNSTTTTAATTTIPPPPPALTFEQRDKAVRSQNDRRRGWSDYRVLFVATHVSGAVLSQESIAQALCGDTERKLEIKGRSGIDTWNTFEVRGEEKIVSLLTPPVMYGRFPNYRARDITIQSADAIIVVVSPHNSSISAMPTLDMVRNSLKGKFHKNYRARARHVIPSYDNVKFPAAEQPRPTYIVLSESRKDFDAMVKSYSRWKVQTKESGKTFEQALEDLRKECAEFMKEFGEAHGVKLFTLPENNDVTDLASFVVRACEDIEENQGVTFKIKEIPPLPSTFKSVVVPPPSVSSPVPVPQLSIPTISFPTLDQVNNKTAANNNNVISWNALTNTVSALF